MVVNGCGQEPVMPAVESMGGRHEACAIFRLFLGSKVGTHIHNIVQLLPVDSGY